MRRTPKRCAAFTRYRPHSAKKVALPCTVPSDPRGVGDLTARIRRPPVTGRVRCSGGSAGQRSASRTDVRAWIEAWNADPNPFVWPRTADEILESPPHTADELTTHDTSRRC